MLEYAAKMASAHHLAVRDDVQRLRDVGFSDAEILHVLYWVAHFNMANTLADGVGREVHENMTAVFVDDVPSRPVVTVSREELRPGVLRAEVRALEGLPLQWINGPPMTWANVRGRALLVLLWDAAHPNSLAAIPHLSRWHEAYDRDGLAVIGVHAAEFPLSKDAGWARAEIARLGVRFPIALDPAFRRITGSNNRYWPALHLIDRDGFVRFRQYGPGGFDTLDARIQSVLASSPASQPEPVVEGASDETWLHPDASPELYATFYIGAQAELGGTPGAASDFVIPNVIEPHRLYVEGRWIRRDDGLRLDGGTGRCTARYQAREVFLLASPGQHPSTIRVALDGAPVPSRNPGRDVDAQSSVLIDRPRLVSLTAHPAMEAHRLDLETDDAGVTIHRISFLPFRGEVID